MYHQQGANPFNPFFIISDNSKEILYYTQAFALVSGYNPSTMPSTISIASLDNLNLKYRQVSQLGEFKVFQNRTKTAILLKERDSLAKNLDHELRTASLLIDLSTEIMFKENHSPNKLFKILLNASRRQKTITLISSDFIRLITAPPTIFSISFMDFLNNVYDSLLDKPQVKFKSRKSFKQILSCFINPKIYGNFQFLTQFFETLFMWFEPIPFSFEIGSSTPISLQVNLSISANHNLSKFQCYSLMSNFLYFISAYFNYRSWMTPNSIIIEFPLVLSGKYKEDYKKHKEWT
ncbi:MAG: hypothetical protein ACFE95_00500 [Candidatus Hodarchaeota archaeon]